MKNLNSKRQAPSGVQSLPGANFDAEWFQQYRRRLGSWYDKHHRPLPWRATRDPYAIWISETMLQQTQVATVIDYYLRFLNRFPNAIALAEADDQQVMQLWAGLGYYRRARQLHAAAKVIVQKFGGQFPKAFDDIISLPGVGRYTAGAIGSFAFDLRSPIVEANTARLYSRLIGLELPVQNVEAQRQLWAFAEACLPARQGSGRVNQAAMELGSQICKPDRPLCSSCVLNSQCSARSQGRELTIPAAATKPRVTPKTHVGVIIVHNAKVLLRRSPPGEWWQGLWDFPRADLDTVGLPTKFNVRTPSASANLSAVANAMEQQFGLCCRPSEFAKSIKHAVTRYRITWHCFSASLEEQSVTELDGEWQWCGKPQELPLSAPSKRLWSLLQLP